VAKMIRAGVVQAFGKPLSIEEIPIPTPGPGEVLIKVVASGVCHTDLHAAEGDWPLKPSLRFVPGHEGVGIIAACGPGVAGLKEGDHAGVAWLHDACGWMAALSRAMRDGPAAKLPALSPETG
jgi:alcohol dehydrogenase, propanol-preferring